MDRDVAGIFTAHRSLVRPQLEWVVRKWTGESALSIQKLFWRSAMHHTHLRNTPIRSNRIHKSFLLLVICENVVGISQAGFDRGYDQVPGEKTGQLSDYGVQAVREQLGLVTLAPRGVLRFPQLDCLVEIVDEEAHLSCFEIGKAKPERLLWLAVAGDHDAMHCRRVQSVNLHAFSNWPSYRLQSIDF